MDNDAEDDYYWTSTDNGLQKILKCKARQALTMASVTQVQVLRFASQQLADIKQGIAGLFAAASERVQDDEIQPTTSADERRFSPKLAAIKESIQIAEAVLGGARFTVKLSHFLLDEALYSPHLLGVSARAEAEYFKGSPSNYEAQMFDSGDYELRGICTRAYPILSALEDAVAIAQDPESSFSKRTAELQSLCSHKQILLHYRGKQYLRDDLRILYATACQALPIAMALADEIRHYATSALSGSPGMPFELLSGSISAPDGVLTSHRQFPNIAIPGTLHRAFQTLQNAGFQVMTAFLIAELTYSMGCDLLDERKNRARGRRGDGNGLRIPRWSTSIILRIWDCHFRAESMAEACLFGQSTTPLLEEYMSLWGEKTKRMKRGRDAQKRKRARLRFLSSVQLGYRGVNKKLARTTTGKVPKN